MEAGISIRVGVVDAFRSHRVHKELENAVVTVADCLVQGGFLVGVGCGGVDTAFQKILCDFFLVLPRRPVERRVTVLIRVGQIQPKITKELKYYK